jgi:ATP-grasp domain
MTLDSWPRQHGETKRPPVAVAHTAEPPRDVPEFGLRVTHAFGPSVVFVDDGPWESFLQLAAALRKVGIRTVHVTVGSARLRATDLLFDRTILFPDPPDAFQLAEILSNEYVADVQTTDNLASTTYAALGLLPPEHRSNLWVGRAAVFDKSCVSTVLRNAGLRTPETLPLDSTSPAEAVAQLSLPIVLKRKVSAAGVDVRVIDSYLDLELCVAKIERRDEWFFERYVAGSSLVCASCVSEDGIDVMATYEVLSRTSELGPSSQVRFYKDEKLAETGRQLIATLRLTGLACFDVIRDSDGTDWIHDVNPRVFGSFAMCQVAGFDFLGAYLRCLTGTGTVKANRNGLSTMDGFAFPGGRTALYGSGHAAAWWRLYRWTMAYRRYLGSRYLLFLAARQLSAVVRKLRRGPNPVAVEVSRGTRNSVRTSRQDRAA